jgi:hypothetical protein
MGRGVCSVEREGGRGGPGTSRPECPHLHTVHYHRCVSFRVCNQLSIFNSSTVQFKYTYSSVICYVGDVCFSLHYNQSCLQLHLLPRRCSRPIPGIGEEAVFSLCALYAVYVVYVYNMRAPSPIRGVRGVREAVLLRHCRIRGKGVRGRGIRGKGIRGRN